MHKLAKKASAAPGFKSSNHKTIRIRASSRHEPTPQALAPTSIQARRGWRKGLGSSRYALLVTSGFPLACRNVGGRVVVVEKQWQQRLAAMGTQHDSLLSCLNQLPTPPLLVGSAAASQPTCASIQCVYLTACSAKDQSFCSTRSLTCRVPAEGGCDEEKSRQGAGWRVPGGQGVAGQGESVPHAWAARPTQCPGALPPVGSPQPGPSSNISLALTNSTSKGLRDTPSR